MGRSVTVHPPPGNVQRAPVYASRCGASSMCGVVPSPVDVGSLDDATLAQKHTLLKQKEGGSRLLIKHH